MSMPAAAVAAVAVAAWRCCACPVPCAGLAVRRFSDCSIGSCSSAPCCFMLLPQSTRGTPRRIWLRRSWRALWRVGGAAAARWNGSCACPF